MIIPPKAALNHAFQVFFPTQCRCGEPLPEELTNDLLTETADKMTGWFGGETDIKDAIGRYMMEDGKVAREPVISAISYSDNVAFRRHRDDFFVFARYLADRLTQETIGIRIDKEMYFIPMRANCCIHEKKFDPAINQSNHANKAAYLRVA